MSGDPADPDYNPERWLLDWQPHEPERTIACTCGASVHLEHVFNACPNCGTTWDRWGGHVWGAKQP